MSKPKRDLIDKIFIKNQLAIKTNQLTDLSNQMLTFKNWNIYFSFVLGYIKFQQPHDNKKLCFSVTSLD